MKLVAQLLVGGAGLLFAGGSPASAAVGAAPVAAALEPNPPAWPESVQVFNAAQPAAAIEAKVNAAFAENGGHDPPNNGQFSSARYAFLFKPGQYAVEVPVGFYTQVLGLGASPADVTFSSEKGVYCEEGDYDFEGGALDTFWRSAENFHTAATWASTIGAPGMLWAVSQAAPLRRIQVDHALTLFEYQPPYQGAGYASGGYFANVEVGSAGSREQQQHKHGKKAAKVGQLRQPANSRATAAAAGAAAATGPHDGPAVNLGSQQQWFARNSKVSEWSGGVWNVVVAGVDGALQSHCSNDNGVPITNVPKVPLVIEKPYIISAAATSSPSAAAAAAAASAAASDKFSLVVPAVKKDSAGVDFDASTSTVVGFEQVYVSQPTDSAATINAKLAAGLHVVLTPAIYDLEAPLELSHDNQVLLGLGMATLRPTKGTEAVVVGNVDGARVAGLIVQAGPPLDGKVSPALVRFGDGTHAGTAANPSSLHDIFCRVGGPDGTAADPVGADTMVEINSGFVIGDNFWLWRADHTVSGAADPQYNPVKHGLVVTGNDVSMYGLAVEHTLNDLVQWTGERGTTMFFQSELPYTVNQTFGEDGYAGYRVGPDVKDHDAFGIGVYSNFVNDVVEVESAIVAPTALEDRFIAPMTVFLNGQGEVKHVINDKGAAANNASRTSYVC